VDSADYYISQSPLGHCLALPGPPPRNFFEDTTNPRDPPQAVGREWAATPVANWPLGLRVIGSTGSPREPNEEEIAGEPATPDLTDVEALRWISELSPFRRRRDVVTRAAHRTWYDRCIALFSVPGLYAAIIKRLGFPGGCRRRERFPFDTRNLDAIQVALWFHDHSLYPIRPEVQDIERWVRLVRGLDGEIQDADSQVASETLWIGLKGALSQPKARTWGRLHDTTCPGIASTAIPIFIYILSSLPQCLA
jgi:hypothetical protein